MSKFIDKEKFEKLSEYEKRLVLKSEENYQSREITVEEDVVKTVKELHEKNRKKDKNTLNQ